MSESEETLIDQVRQGDEHAYSKLFEKYQPMLYRAMYYRAGNDRLAQDLVQETFLKVWVNRERLKPHLAFYAYILKLSKNLLLDHYKREEVRTRHAGHVRFLEEKPSRTPEQDHQKHLLEERIQQAVYESLPEKCRAVFILSRVEGMSNQDIADTLKVSKKTVENQLYRALKILRKQCKDHL